MTPDNSFWQGMGDLLITNPITIDRPRGSSHPRCGEVMYPLHYGYLENTTASDGGGIEVWIGSSKSKTLTGILCTFDTLTEYRPNNETRNLIVAPKFFKNVRQFMTQAVNVTQRSNY